MYVFVFNKGAEKKETDQLILKAAYAYCEACYGPAYECACCRGCGIADSEHMPKIARSENGKPYFLGENMPFFSVSHSGDYVLIAMAPFEIGVDIEFIKTLSTSLKERLAMPTGSDADVIAQWTKLEAYIKYKGGRLFAELDTAIPDDLFFTEVNLDPAYVCTVCAAKEENVWIKEIK